MIRANRGFCPGLLYNGSAFARRLAKSWYVTYESAHWRDVRPDVRLEHTDADGVLQLIRENDLLHARVEELTGQLTIAETQGEQTTRELYQSLPTLPHHV